MAQYNIAAGFPWSALLKIQKKAFDATEYADLASVEDTPYRDWSLHFIDDNNRSRCGKPFDIAEMIEKGWVKIDLTEEDTKRMSGRTMHLAIRNDIIVSDLMIEPDVTFYFVPNNIPLTKLD